MLTRLEWICRQPTPYNDVLFRALARDPEIDLTVHFSTEAISSHPWRSPLGVGYASRFFDRSLGLDWELLHRARTTSSLIVSGGWNDHTILAVLTRRLLN